MSSKLAVDFMLTVVYKESRKGELNMTFTYSADLISDLHKDAYGFRPRGRFFDDWAEASDVEKQEMWDIMTATLEANSKAEQEQALKDVAQMEADIAVYITFGARDRADALRWMTQNETFFHSQCVEGWVWQKGILFTKYGKALVQELLQVVKYNNTEAA
tara:strand:+ start:394 stop:873 length:480 start_codon:yes stop_codon:yes gene_type:complete